MKLKKGDKILVIAGKDKGKTGSIERCFPRTNQVLVGGVNIIKKHVKRQRKISRGGIIEINKPISASNVMLVCPSCNKPTRVGFQTVDNDKKVRICKKCKEIIES